MSLQLATRYSVRGKRLLRYVRSSIRTPNGEKADIQADPGRKTSRGRRRPPRAYHTGPNTAAVLSDILDWAGEEAHLPD